MRMNVGDDDPDNYENPSDSMVINIFESRSSIPRVDGIDYLQDVNVAVQDIINLLKASLETLKLSLSRSSDLSPSSRNSEPENVDATFPLEETSEVDAEESGNDVDSFRREISTAAYDFLTKFRYLIDYTEKLINVSPTKQRDKDRKLRHAVRSRKKTETEIKLLEDALAIQRTEHEKSVEKLNKELNECQKLIDQRSEEIKNQIGLIVNKSEIKMVTFYKESVARQKLLNSEMKILESRLHNLRGNNILMEKKLRNKRSRVETQLLNSLKKYDADIGGRHRDMENLAKEFQLLNSEKKMLEEDVMTNLRKLHDDLQQEKAEALRKILNEKLEKFVRNRAARVVQRAWRAYWERHCAKKKKKSRKK